MQPPPEQITLDDLQDPEAIPLPVQTTGTMDRGLARELRREAKYYASLIPDVLADIGYDHWIRKEARPTGFEEILFNRSARQKVKILHVAYHEAAIFLRIDPLRLPYRVTVKMLRDDEMLETLSLACGCRVTFHLADYSKGAWLRLDREGALGAIPKRFTFRDALANVPENSGPLKYCAGVGENMKLLMPDIAKMPHLLVAGATQNGKSVHLHAIIGQLLWRNSPDKLKLLMIDLKGGMELQDYRSVPHLWQPIVTEIEGVVEALQRFKKEMIDRQKLFAGKARSLDEYNRYGRDRLPYIVLVIDELAMVLRHPQRELSEAAKLELGAILAVSRATGGHAILCTQRPDVTVIDGYIKANIDARVCFKVATQADSRVVLDVSDAAEIPLKGRAWMLYGSDRTQIQCPWISPYVIKRLVDGVTKRYEEPKPEIGIMDLIAVSLERFNGRMPIKDLYAEFKPKGLTEPPLRAMLQSMDGEVFEYQGLQYFVNPGTGGQNGRHLEQIEFMEGGTGNEIPETYTHSSIGVVDNA